MPPRCRTVNPGMRCRAGLRRLVSLLLVAWLLLLAGPSLLLAQEAVITDFTIANNEEYLLLYLQVEKCFTAEMEEALRNGIPATFTFLVEVLQTRKAWPDHEIVSLAFNHLLSYDSLKEEYRIELAESNEVVKTGSLAAAKKIMAEISGFRVASLNRLVPEKEYLLRVKAKLAKKTLPLYFHYLIPFTSLWDFETDWYEINFKY